MIKFERNFENKFIIDGLIGFYTLYDSLVRSGMKLTKFKTRRSVGDDFGLWSHTVFRTDEGTSFIVSNVIECSGLKLSEVKIVKFIQYPTSDELEMFIMSIVCKFNSSLHGHRANCSLIVKDGYELIKLR